MSAPMPTCPSPREHRRGRAVQSGQSCCGVERVYVHEAVWEDFVEKAVASAEAWRLGHPDDPDTTLGLRVRPRNAAAIQARIDRHCGQAPGGS